MFDLGNLDKAGETCTALHDRNLLGSRDTHVCLRTDPIVRSRSSLKISIAPKARFGKPAFPANQPWRSSMGTAHSSFRHGSSRFEAPSPSSTYWLVEDASVFSEPSTPRSSGKSSHNFSTTPLSTGQSAVHAAQSPDGFRRALRAALAPCARRHAEPVRLQPVTQADSTSPPPSPDAGSRPTVSAPFRFAVEPSSQTFRPAVPPDGFPTWSRKPLLGC